MCAWHPEPVDHRPHIALSEWAVFEVPSNGADRNRLRELRDLTAEVFLAIQDTQAAARRMH